MQTGLCKKPEEYTFPVWKTLKLVHYESVQEITEVMLSNGQKVFDYAKEIMDFKEPFFLLKGVNEVKLHKASLADLGFTQGAQFHAIGERISKLGYAICFPEIGPRLRINYRDQPKREKLFVLMEPMFNLEMFELIFLLGGNDRGRQTLSTYWWSRDFIFPPKSEWVFMSPIDYGS